MCRSAGFGFGRRGFVRLALPGPCWLGGLRATLAFRPPASRFSFSFSFPFRCAGPLPASVLFFFWSADFPLSPFGGAAPLPFLFAGRFSVVSGVLVSLSPTGFVSLFFVVRFLWVPACQPSSSSVLVSLAESDSSFGSYGRELGLRICGDANVRRVLTSGVSFFGHLT